MGHGGVRHLDSYGIWPLELPETFSSSTGRPLSFQVDLDRTVTACGFSYTPEGWHPYAASLRELLDDPEHPYEDSTLARFYDRFQPRSVQAALGGDQVEDLAPIATWPPIMLLLRHLWALTPRHVRQVLDDPSVETRLTQHVGPQPRVVGRHHLERILAVHHALRSIGYRPNDFADGHLAGYFLVRGDDYRFVVIDGNHRLPAFRELGIGRPRATILRGHPPVVDAADLTPWTTGRFGVFSPSAARYIFRALFDAGGRERARTLQLL